MTGSRKDDGLIPEMRDDIKEIKKILIGNGELGVVGQTIVNTNAIDKLQKKGMHILNKVMSIAVTTAAIFSILKLTGVLT